MKRYILLLSLLAGYLFGSYSPILEASGEPDVKKNGAASTPKAGENAAEEKGNDPTKKVEAKPLTIETEISGVIESTKATPIALNLKRWTDLVVVNAVDHGAAVKKGDVLIELETEMLEEKIEDLEGEMPVKKLELEMAHRDLEKLEKTTPLTLEKASRAKIQAEEDLAYFEDVSRPMRERDAKEDVKTTTNYLAYAEEELNQLKKMYEQDDLTEETEEIILKRAQNSVDSYRWMLEQTETRAERTLNTDIPREHERLKSDLELRQLNWRAGEQSTRDTLQKARYDLEEKKRIFQETEATLSEYKSDLESMKVTAPHDGVVYHGMSQLGKWTTASTVARKLIPGGKLTMREITMTVADPSAIRVRLSVPEDKLKDLTEGQRGHAILEWEGETEIPIEMESVSYVPFADNTYDAVASFEGDGDRPKMYPGMKAKAKFVVYETAKALLVPKAAVHGAGEERHVLMIDGKKQIVKTGREKGAEVEIVDGLKAGDVIRLPKPAKPEKGLLPKDGSEEESDKK